MGTTMRWILVLALLGLLLAGCAGGAAPPPAAADVEQAAGNTPAEAAADEQAAQVPATGHEAPTLAERVAAGELPPLEERLPNNPLVVDVVERIGVYGGTWRMGLRGGADSALLIRTIGYDNLVRWDISWSEVIPNVAESFEAGADSTEFTFRLREGMKWSDGAPFTADDIMFWYEDVFLNEELTPVKTSWMVVDGEPVLVEKVDDLTVKFTFAEPNGLFLYQMASPEGIEPTRYPRHYLEQFHIQYNPDGIDALIEEAGADGWVNLFQLKGGGVPGTSYDARWQNGELPTLYPWVMTTPYGAGAQVVAERNPYYWKVDPEGNQLPYIDRLVYEIGEEVDVLVLKALNGELDMQERHISSLANKTVFFDNMEQGDYHFFETRFADMNVGIITFNRTHKDPALRAIFDNKDFRIAMSHAINRQEIIDAVFVGQGEPWQAAPRPESPFYHERLAKQYTEYDVDLANEHLDRAGLTERDAEGFRLRPDGERLAFNVDIISVKQDWIDMMELVVRHWAEVGVQAYLNVIDRSLVYTRIEANDQDATMWWADGGAGLDTILDPYMILPVENDTPYGVLWSYWYLGDPRGEEPPDAIKQQQALYDQVKSTADLETQKELMKQVLDISADELYGIGISLRPPGYGIVKNNFHNVPESMPHAWTYPAPAPTNPVQYFISQGQE